MLVLGRVFIEREVKSYPITSSLHPLHPLPVYGDYTTQLYQDDAKPWNFGMSSFTKIDSKS